MISIEAYNVVDHLLLQNVPAVLNNYRFAQVSVGFPVCTLDVDIGGLFRDMWLFKGVWS